MPEKISVYIHIPFCKSKCCYCDFFSRTDLTELADSYVNALCNEISFYAGQSDYALSTLYIGGGTPSLLSLESLNKILSCITENFKIISDDFEGTIELNPDDVSESLMSFIENSILTRISLGIQSLKSETLLKMNRRSSRITCLNALELIKKNFSKRFSADLIAGFPGETQKDLADSIYELLRYEPEHISLYSLCVEEKTPLFDMIALKKICYNQDYADECWLAGKEILKNSGFIQYEISNFARNKKAFSRHNLTYWHLENYLGFGSGAASSIYDYKGGQSFRYSNTCNIGSYISFWNNHDNIQKLKKSAVKTLGLSGLIPAEFEKLDRKTEEFEFFMMNLRLDEGFSKNEYKRRFGKPVSDKLNSDSGVFAEWQKKGLAEICHSDYDDYYRLTEKGLL